MSATGLTASTPPTSTQPAAAAKEWAQRTELLGALRWAREPGELEDAELVVLPGSKHVAADLGWLYRTGLAEEVRRRERMLYRSVAIASCAAPLLVVIAEPANPRIVAVFLASLWATGMLLYGIGVRDVPLAVLGLVIVVVAAVIRLVAPHEAVLAVGLAGGLGMTGLGGWRMRWRR